MTKRIGHPKAMVNEQGQSVSTKKKRVNKRTTDNSTTPITINVNIFIIPNNDQPVRDIHNNRYSDTRIR